MEDFLFSGGCLAWNLLFTTPRIFKNFFIGGLSDWHLLFSTPRIFKASFSGGGSMTSPFAAVSVQNPELLLLH